MNIKKAFEAALSLPKTLYFNIYYLPLKQAIQLPFRVSWRTTISNMGSRHSVKLMTNAAKIQIGFGGSFDLGGKTYWKISDSGKVVFNGNASIGAGTRIIADGKLEFGDDFYCNANCIINCGDKILFGDNVLIGWEVTILDGDGHYLYDNGTKQKKYAPVIIGNHVWIASKASVLKGSLIKDNSVIAFDGLVSKAFQKEGLLIGNTNQILKQDINWEK